MKQVQPLSEQEVKALKQLHRETNNADVRSRCDMILLSHEGLSLLEIAERVRFSRWTVSRYIDRFEAEGVKGLFTQARAGRPPRVTSEYVTKLLEIVDQNPRDLGLHFSNWTTEKLATYMAEQTSIVITPRQVENYLKAHDWRLRRLVRTVKHKQDPDLFEEKKTHQGTPRPTETNVHRAFR